jgi:hypothetical protein
VRERWRIRGISVQKESQKTEMEWDSVFDACEVMKGRCDD